LSNVCGAAAAPANYTTALRPDHPVSVLPFAGLELLMDHEAADMRFEANRTLRQVRLRVRVILQNQRGDHRVKALQHAIFVGCSRATNPEHCK